MQQSSSQFDHPSKNQCSIKITAFLCYCRAYEISQDTLFDYLVFHSSKFLHHDVYKAGNQTSEKADQPAHNPATDLQTAETLKQETEEKGRETADNSMEGLHVVQI